MKRAMVNLEAAVANGTPAAPHLAAAVTIADTFRTMPFEVNLWQAQNIRERSPPPHRQALLV